MKGHRLGLVVTPMVTNPNREIVHSEPQPGKQKVTKKRRGSQRVKQIRNQFSIPVKFPDTPPDIGTRNRSHKRGEEGQWVGGGVGEGTGINIRT